MIIFEYEDIFRLIRDLNLLEDVAKLSVKELYELEIKNYLSEKLRNVLRQKALAGYTEKEILESGILDEIDTLTSPDAILSFSSINEYEFEYNLADSEIPDSLKALTIEEGELEEEAAFIEELLAIILSRNILDSMTDVMEVEGQAAEVL